MRDFLLLTPIFLACAVGHGALFAIVRYFDRREQAKREVAEQILLDYHLKSAAARGGDEQLLADFGTKVYMIATADIKKLEQEVAIARWKTGR